MGLKENLEEIQQERFDKELAEKLGITYDELLELEYECNEVVSEDGLVYRRYIKFNPEYGKDVLKKIRLDSDYVFYLLD